MGAVLPAGGAVCSLPSSLQGRLTRPGPARVRADVVVDGAVAGLAGWLCSEVPSSLHAWSTGRSWRATDEAAGNLVLSPGASPHRLRAVGTALRVAAAANWGVVMSRWLDHRRPVAHGAAIGLALFGFEYQLLGRRRPLVRALPALPQLADQLVFGTVAGAVLARRRAGRACGTPPMCRPGSVGRRWGP